MATTSKFKFEMVDVSKIAIIEGFNPRPENEVEEGLDDLALSIKQIGIQTPLIGKTLADGKIGLLAGHRRFAAAQKVRDLKRLPVNILKVDLRPEEELQIAMADANSKPLSPLGMANAVERLIKICGLTDKEVATQFGISAVYVGKMKKLATVAKAPEVKEAIANGEISATEVVKIADQAKSDGATDIVDATKKVVVAAVKKAKDEGRKTATAKTVEKVRTPAPTEPKVSRTTVKEILEMAVTTIDTAVGQINAGKKPDVSSLINVLEESFRIGIKAFNNDAGLDFQRLRIEYGDSMGK